MKAKSCSSLMGRLLHCKNGIQIPSPLVFASLRTHLKMPGLQSLTQRYCDMACLPPQVKSDSEKRIIYKHTITSRGLNLPGSLAELSSGWTGSPPLGSFVNLHSAAHSKPILHPLCCTWHKSQCFVSWFCFVSS